MRTLFVCMLVACLFGSPPASASPFVVASATAEHAITINAASGAGPSLNATDAFDGVGRLSITTGAGSFLCSGSLLLSGMHVLTAGHCVAGMTSAAVTFLNTAGSMTIAAAGALTFPGYTGDVFDPRDMAILTLVSEVFGVDRYDIYRTTDEGNQIGTLVGYGRAGSGTGTDAAFPSGSRRDANNYIDGYWDPGFGGLTSLAFDFDNPGFSPAIDPLGTCFGALQGGVAGEGLIAPGDSGGPLFLAGLVAGVHSWIGTYGPACGDDYTDPVSGNYLNSSWGEVGGDARVSIFSAWIDANAPVPVQEPTPVPEPGTLLLLGSGLIGVGSAVRRRR